MNDEHLHPLFAALLKLLRPLVRILLRNGVSHRTFAEIAKWGYVDVAHQEFGLEGRKQSISRVSVLTGLSRKEVMRVRNLHDPRLTQTVTPAGTLDNSNLTDSFGKTGLNVRYV